MTIIPTLDHLRRYAIARSLFAPTTLSRAIAKLGFVQADPIRAPARAQDLTLRHRVAGYRAGDLEARYPRLARNRDILPTSRNSTSSCRGCRTESSGHPAPTLAETGAVSGTWKPTLHAIDPARWLWQPLPNAPPGAACDRPHSSFANGMPMTLKFARFAAIGLALVAVQAWAQNPPSSFSQASQETQAVADPYFKAYIARDWDHLEPLLADQGGFADPTATLVFGPVKFEGKQATLDVVEPE